MKIISWLQNMIIDNKIESIFIESMDNPGWSIKIDANDNLESGIECKKEDIRSEDDWISVSFNSTSYTLMGGANN